MNSSSPRPNPPPDSGFIYLPVPREVVAAASPRWVSEHTCEAVFGLNAGRFVRACKTGKIHDARKDGQLWVAPVPNVEAYLCSLPTRARLSKAKVPETAVNDFESLPLPSGVRRRR